MFPLVFSVGANLCFSSLRFDCLILKKVTYCYWYFIKAPGIKIVGLALPLTRGEFPSINSVPLGQQEVLSWGPSSLTEVFKLATLCSGGWLGPWICRLPNTDQSDESEVADERDPSFRIIHPLNLFHSAFLSFANMVLTFLLPKPISFLVLLSVSPLPRPYLSGIPRMKNYPSKMCLRRKSLASICVGRLLESLFLLQCGRRQGEIVFNVQIEQLDNTLRCNRASCVSTAEMACFL